MQPVPQRYEEPESAGIQPATPRKRVTDRERLISAVTSVRFWGGLSVLVAFVSLALPWWGITVTPIANSSWGLFFGPQSQGPNVVFLQDRLDTAFAGSYSLMTALVLLTALSTTVGVVLKRSSILAISLVLSVITVLTFIWDVANAVNTECERVLVEGASCISGLVGQGTSGSDFVAWGFQAGFYTFIASTTILLGTLALQRSK